MASRIEPSDDLHLILACLFHDIGYVRGALSGDTRDEFVVSADRRRIALPRGASDASLTPYHVDRSKLFAIERLGQSPDVDAERIAEAIEYTRFPPSPERKMIDTEDTLPRLVQAADLIGQLGDPMYDKNVNSLFYEFEDICMIRQLAYSSPPHYIPQYHYLRSKAHSTTLAYNTHYIS